MRSLQLEGWVLDIADQISNGRVPEDSRVELKASWPEDHAKAARRLAGHANAAAGDPVLWIIGIDEKVGVAGVSTVDTASWTSAVFAQFDGICPSVTDLIVRIGGKTVVALLFDTDRAPFVVANPQFGTSGVVVSHEMPWREGTKVRSARREDLIRLLSRATQAPEVEVLDAAIDLAHADSQGNDNIHFSVDLYVVPNGDTVVIPFHRGSFTVDGDRIEVPIASAQPGARYLRGGVFGLGRGPASHTVFGADNEIIFEGPGRATFRGSCRLAYPPQLSSRSPFRLVLGIAGNSAPLIIRGYLEVQTSEPSGKQAGKLAAAAT